MNTDADRIPPIVHLDESMLGRERHERLVSLHEGLLALGHDSRVVCQHGSALHRRLVAAALPHYAMRWLGPHDLFAAHRLGAWARHTGALLHAHSAPTLRLAAWAGRISGPGPLVSSAHPSARGWSASAARASIHLASSEDAALLLRASGTDADRIEVVPQGIDVVAMGDVRPDHAWRASFGMEPGEILVGTLVANEEEHAPAPVVLACELWRARAGSGRLALLGDGEPGIDLLPRIAAVDIFVGCARPWAPGIEVLEAMALGKPVVARRGGAADAWIESERSGELIDVEHERALPVAIAEALGRLQGSASRRQSLGHAARARAENFDLLETVERTVAVYRRAIGAR